MSPRIGPRPAGVRYRVQVTEILPDGTQTDLGLDQTGDAYIVGVATLTGNRINAFTDHDANNHQIDRIKAEAHERGVKITILIDFIHVLEYIWSAAWSFFDEADPAAKAWITDNAMNVLEGHGRQVATGIRRRATREGLDPPRRINADKTARYLTNKADHLDYLSDDVWDEHGQGCVRHRG